MATIPYNLSVPNPNVPPKNDAAPMQANTNGNSLIWQEDHYTFGQDSKDGQHAVIRQPIRNPDNDPAAISSPATGQTYTKTANGTLQLFYETPTGVVNQISPTISASTDSGYIRFSSGLMFQWGRVGGSTGTGTGTVTFPQPFTSRCDNVELTLTDNNSQPNQPVTLMVNRITQVSPPLAPPTSTQFQWARTTSSGASLGFYWFAIGD